MRNLRNRVRNLNEDQQERVLNLMLTFLERGTPDGCQQWRALNSSIKDTVRRSEEFNKKVKSGKGM